MDMNPISKGDDAPDFNLIDLQGKPFSLHQFTVESNKNILLVFLRHLGWLPWREHVQALHANISAFDSLDTKIVLISFVGGSGALSWRNETGLPEDLYPFLLDEGLEVYHAYGLVQGSHEQIWSLKSRAYYLWKKLKGEKLYQIDGDPYQLGGDFIIDKRGKCIMAYRSIGPTDRPTVHSILNCLTQADIQWLELQLKWKYYLKVQMGNIWI